MSADAPTGKPVPPLSVSAELKALLRRLKLGRMLDTLPERLALAHTNRLPHHDFLELLLADEIARRDRQAATLRARAAGLDPSMHLDAWDDTAAVSYDRSTGASRTTTLMGLAIQRAARDARAQLVRWAEEALAPDGPAVVEERDGVSIGGKRYDWGDLVRAWFGGASGEVVGRGYVRRAGATEEMPPFWEVGCVGVEASVDEETGEIRLERLVTVGDVGCAINPQLVESQDVGAAVMGAPWRPQLHGGPPRILNLYIS